MTPEQEEIKRLVFKINRLQEENKKLQRQVKLTVWYWLSGGWK